MNPEVVVLILVGLLVAGGAYLYFREYQALKPKHAQAIPFDFEGLPELLQDVETLGMKAGGLHWADVSQVDLVAVDLTGHLWIHPDWSARVSPPIIHALVLRAWVEGGAFRFGRWSTARQVSEISSIFVFILLARAIPGGIGSWVFWAVVFFVISPFERRISRALKGIQSDRLALERTGSVRAVTLGWGKMGRFGADAVGSKERPSLEFWLWSVRWSSLKKRSVRDLGQVDISDEELRTSVGRRLLSVQELASIQEFIR